VYQPKVARSQRLGGVDDELSADLGIGPRSIRLDTVVCLTLDEWETVSGQFEGYLKNPIREI
jgi:hypothetical protein